MYAIRLKRMHFSIKHFTLDNIFDRFFLYFVFKESLNFDMKLFFLTSTNRMKADEAIVKKYFIVALLLYKL